MHRIDGPRVAAVMPISQAPAGAPGYFQPGDPTHNLKGTQVTAAWLNTVQEEIAGVVESADLSLDKADNKQLAAAIPFIVRRFSPKYEQDVDFYLDSLIGDDNNTGTTSEKPLRSKDALFAKMLEANFHKHAATINLGAGGWGSLNLNSSTETAINPTLLKINFVGDESFQSTMTTVRGTSPEVPIIFNGIFFSSDTSSTLPLVTAENGTTIEVFNCRAQNTSSNLLFQAQTGGALNLGGTINVVGNFLSAVSTIIFGRLLILGGTEFKFTNSTSMNSFVQVDRSSLLQCASSVTFSTKNIAGQRYRVSRGSGIYTYGAGESFFPGTAAGSFDATSYYA